MGRVTIVETDLEFRNELQDRPYTDAFVIHHIGEINRDVSAAEIHQWHLANGWSGVGYNYIIRKDGSIERGRPRTKLGAHCEGYNSRSIGINVVGDFTSNEPEPAQIESLVKLLADLCEIYSLDPLTNGVIIGHRDKGNTDCPGDNLYNQIWQLVTKVKGLI